MIPAIQSVFLNQNGIKLEINKGEVCRTIPKYLKLGNTLLNKTWIKGGIKMEIRNQFY